MKTLAFLSFVVVAVSAGKSDSASASGSGTSAAPAAAPSVIPTDISSGCATFLNQLDQDSTLKSCLSSLTSATAAFSAGSTPSSSEVSSALSSLCSDSTASACGDSFFRTQLTSFYSACSAELTGGNPESGVRTLYESLYLIAPFRESACSQDSSGSYCVQTLAAASSSSSLVQQAKSYLSQTLQGPLKRATSSFVQPNATTFNSASIPFMFLTSSTPTSTLCSTCAQNVMKPYVSFESSMAFAYGVTNSQLLGGQKALWNAISSQCGSDFSGSVVANAGASPTGSTGIGGLSAATANVKVSAGGLVAALLAALIAL